MTLYLNGKTNAEYANPAIMDWLTLSIQDTGQLDYLTMPVTVPQWHGGAAITASANIRYILTRRPIPPLTPSTTGNDYVYGSNTSLSDAAVISGFTAVLDEKLQSTLYLNGRVRGVLAVMLYSSTTVAAYLSSVTVLLYKKNASGTTLIGADTITVGASNATTSGVFYFVPFMMNVSGMSVDPDDVLYLHISTSGYVASAATVYHKIYMIRGGFMSFAEVQV